MIYQTTANRSYPILFLILLTLSFGACKKETSSLGVDVLPDGDILGTVYCDTITILASTKLDSALSANGNRFQLLGSYNDPVFGLSLASFYTQVRSSESFNFLNATSVDSIVLSFAYAGSYGKISKFDGTQTVKVYRVTQDLDTNATSSTDQSYQTDMSPLGWKTMVPNMIDSIKINDSTNAAPHLRIKLDNNFGNEFITQFKGSGDIVFTSDDLVSYLKGFYITVDNPAQSQGQGGIWFMNLDNIWSKLTVYYREDTLTTNRSFAITGSAIKLNHFFHDYTGSPTIKNALNNYNVQDFLYLQSMASLKTRLFFPYLKELAKDDKIAIVSAELIVPVAEGTTEEYSPCSQFAPVKISSEGKYLFVPDELSEGLGAAGGFLNSEKAGYTFYLTRYLQNIVNDGGADYGLDLRRAGGPVAGDRVIVNGPKHPSNPMKLKLKYIKTDK